jgi:uncharacterized membrane protein HdeD (DUF308 family)
LAEGNWHPDPAPTGYRAAVSSSEPRRPRIAVILLAVMAVLFILSGISGITVGGVSAQAGWWLVVVGIIGLALIAVDYARNRA